MKIVLIVGGVLIAGAVLLVLVVVLAGIVGAVFPKQTPGSRAMDARTRAANRASGYRPPRGDIGCLPVVVVLGVLVAVWFFSVVIYYDTHP